MVRKEGFIDLDSLLKKSGIDVDSIDNLEVLRIDNKMYFFKESFFTYPYTELLGEELLNDYGLPSVFNDLAVFKDNKGVISRNSHEEGYSYISARTIFWDYIEYLDEEKKYSITPEYNNLEFLWNALDYRYKDRKNGKEIVSKLMEQLVDLFIFDLITFQGDRNSGNYEIKEGVESVELAPIYDNEAILHSTFGEDKIRLVVDEDTNYDIYNELEKFINYSDSSYINKIKDKLWIIDEENLNKKFKRIEDQILEEDGLIITITNNKKKSLAKSEIILNIDFPKELLNKYNIYENAIIVNICGSIKIDKKRFNGLIINDYEISVNDEIINNAVGTNSQKYFIKQLYEAEFYKNMPFIEFSKKIKNDNCEIIKLFSINGIL